MDVKEVRAAPEILPKNASLPVMHCSLQPGLLYRIEGALACANRAQRMGTETRKYGSRRLPSQSSCMTSIPGRECAVGLSTQVVQREGNFLRSELPSRRGLLQVSNLNAVTSFQALLCQSYEQISHTVFYIACRKLFPIETIDTAPSMLWKKLRRVSKGPE